MDKMLKTIFDGTVINPESIVMKNSKGEIINYFITIEESKKDNWDFLYSVNLEREGVGIINTFLIHKKGSVHYLAHWLVDKILSICEEDMEKILEEKYEEEFEDKIYLIDEDYEWVGVPNFVNNELESLLIKYFGVKRVIYTNGGIKGVSPRIPVKVKVRKGKIVIERIE